MAPKKPFFINLLTKKQLVRSYQFAGMTEDKLPRKNAVVTLTVPREGVTIRITRLEKKSTYGKTLYQCEHLLGRLAA